MEVCLSDVYPAFEDDVRDLIDQFSDELVESSSEETLGFFPSSDQVVVDWMMVWEVLGRELAQHFRDTFDVEITVDPTSDGSSIIFQTPINYQDKIAALFDSDPLGTLEDICSERLRPAVSW